MKRWAYIFIGLVALVIVVCICLSYYFRAEERAIARNPIMKQISHQTSAWDTRVNIKPSVFKDVKTRDDFEELVKLAGFKPTETFRFFHSQDLVTSDEFVWSSYKGTFVCNIEWAIIAKFDESEILIAADGVIGERGCL